MNTIVEPNPNSRLPVAIPIYTLSDIVPATPTADFAVQRLDMICARLGRDIPAHRYDHYQLCWITGGCGSLSVDTLEYTITPPALCYFLPGQVHTARASSPLTGYSIHFTHAFFLYDAREQTRLAELPLFYPPDAAPPIQANQRQAATISDLMRKIEQEYHAELADQATVLRAYLHILLVEAKRLRPHLTTIRNSEAGYLLTRRFLLLVETHYRSGASVTEYAAQLHVTAAHLSQTIKRTLNKTARAVIQERVLLEARRLLRYSDLSVAEIAQQLNFQDASYFGRFFKKQTGRSPQAFRQAP